MYPNQIAIKRAISLSKRPSIFEIPPSNLHWINKRSLSLAHCCSKRGFVLLN